MASVSTLRIISVLPNALTTLLVALAIMLGLDSLGSSSLMAFLALAVFVLGLTIVARAKGHRWAEKLSIVVASAALLYVAVFARALDILPLYGLFVLVMMTGEFSGLSEMIQPMRDMPLRDHEVRELKRAISTVLFRLSFVLAASFVLSLIIWISLPLLDIGATSEFTAFALAAVVMIILAILFVLRE